MDPTATPQAGDPVETVPAVIKTNLGPGAPNPVAVRAVSTPTQMRRPWRSTARTVFQTLVALAALLPFIAAGVYDDPDSYPYAVGQVLAVAATVTRVMSLPKVEQFLRRFLPFLAAAPKPKR